MQEPTKFKMILVCEFDTDAIDQEASPFDMTDFVTTPGVTLLKYQVEPAK